MYKVITRYTKPNSSVKYYSASSPPAKAQVDQFNALEAAAAGHVSTERVSTDTTATITHTWAGEGDFVAFINANSAFIAVLAASRDEYQQAYGITRVVEAQTV